MPRTPRRHHPLPHARWFAASAAALLLAVFLGGCGSGDDGAEEVDAGGDGGAGGVEVDADVVVIAEDIDFPTTRFAAGAGEVTIGYVNEGAIRHTLVLEDVDGWDKLVVGSNGDVATGTVELEPGEYTLFCDVAGHRAAGMEGTLTVS